MRPHRLAAVALLALACRREAPAPAPRPAPVDAPRPPAPVDAPAPPASGLTVALSSATAPRHPEGSDAWLVTLNLQVRNPSPDTLALRADALHVTREDEVAGAQTPPGGFEGPASLRPGEVANARLSVVFPPSPSRPVTVTLRLDTAYPLNHPISFPLPGGP